MFIFHCSELLTTLGLLYLSTNNSQAGFDILGTSLSHNPSSAHTLLATASVMQHHDEVNAAMLKYRATAQLTPDSSELWSNIGMTLFAKERVAAAISCLKRAVHLDPFGWISHLNLVRFDFKKKTWLVCHCVSRQIESLNDYIRSFLINFV